LLISPGFGKTPPSSGKVSVANSLKGWARPGTTGFHSSRVTDA
jgi:hypothetical protein